MTWVIGLIGLGTVNKGVLDFYHNSEDSAYLAEKGVNHWRIAEHIVVKDPTKQREVQIPEGCVLTGNVKEVLQDPKVNIVMVATGDPECDRKAIVAALNGGKHVITANKAVIAQYGEDLFKLAQEKGRHLGIEATTMGGDPIISTLQNLPSVVQKLEGVVNGTTNWLLEALDRMPFNEALAQAQKEGIAEADPSADTSGKDAADKAIILARTAFGANMEQTYNLVMSSRNGMKLFPLIIYKSWLAIWVEQ
ncbi:MULTISPECIES: homoserine dehydrogenase [Legionella]|uniref:homoserine dehydrogenase n=1 Tax=Legionella TaxID=445 RepID=UPI000964C764|nr:MULTISPECIES: Gfo/Idh/MocA family oxidoreductase [Legionella]MBN9226473.1 hypothetical protein [Legionella steelei]OJW12206.1 MAG: hypothetical protein BGO44_04030 [Legionella sp. 39-23]